MKMRQDRLVVTIVCILTSLPMVLTLQRHELTPPSPEWHWSWPEMLALLLVTANSITAAATGQGGAQILIPVFTVLLKMSVNMAVAVGAFVIFLGSIPGLHHALTADHPVYKQKRTIIDYQTLTLWLPCMLIGIKAGVVVNVISPQWFVAWVMIATFGWSCCQLLSSYIKIRKKELAAARLKRRGTAARSDIKSGESPAVESCAPTPTPTATAAAAAAAAEDDQKLQEAMVHRIIHQQPPQQQQSCSQSQQQQQLVLPAAPSPAAAAVTAGFSCCCDELPVKVAAELEDDCVTCHPAAAATTPPGVLSTRHVDGVVQRLFLQRTQARLFSWWAVQPTAMLLLVAACFAAYISVCIVQALLHTCSTGYFVVLGAFVLVNGLLTVAAAVLLWPERNAAGHSNSRGAAHNTMPYSRSSSSRLHLLISSRSSSSLSSGCHDDNNSGSSSSSVLQVTSTPQEKAKFTAEGFTGNRITNVILAAHNTNRSSSSSLASLGTSCGSQALILASPALLPPAPAPAPAQAPAAAAAAVSSGYQDVVWTPEKLVLHPILMLFVGALAGLLGTSPGGIICVPIMLSFLKSHPQVACATIKVMLFVTTGASSASYLLNGQLVLSYGLAFGIPSLLVTPLGQWIADHYIKRRSCPSLLVLLNLTRSFVGVVLLVWLNGIPGAMDLAAGHNAGVHTERFCRH